MTKFFKRVFRHKPGEEVYLERENAENIIRLEKVLDRIAKVVAESAAMQTEAIDSFCKTNEKFISVMVRYFEIEISAAEKANAEPRPEPTAHDLIF